MAKEGGDERPRKEGTKGCGKAEAKKDPPDEMARHAFGNHHGHKPKGYRCLVNHDGEKDDEIQGEEVM